MADKNSGIAITALVLGICAFLLGWVPLLGQLIWVAAIVFGILGIIDAKKPGKKGKGMAIAGLILALAWLILFIVLIIAGVSMGVLSAVAGGV